MSVPDYERPMIQVSGWHSASFMAGWLAGRDGQPCPVAEGGDATHSGRVIRAAYLAAQAFKQELDR